MKLTHVLFASGFGVCSVLAEAAACQAPATLPKPTPAAAVGDAVAGAADKDGIPVTTVSTLSSTVSVEAMVLPYRVARRTFGKEVASRYAVVSLTVSNRDPRQGVILQSIFLDYSRWLFSGLFAGLTQSGDVPQEQWQTQTKPSQVASAEVRTVRTDFQDAQAWSARNFLIHIATAVGATAGALAFSTASDLFAPSVAAFNGNVVPALGIIWPDNSQAQLNLLNDIGFRTNHVIPAKSADIVIAFFPLERFLTPTLEKIYRDAPAAFFNPSELLFEDESGAARHGFLWTKSGDPIHELMKDIDRMGIIKPERCLTTSTTTAQCALANSLRRYERAYAILKAKAASTPKNQQPPNPCATITSSSDSESLQPAAGGKTEPTDSLSAEDCLNVDLLNRISLNRIRVLVGGIMTVDVSTIPASIASVQIANGNLPSTWAKGSSISGTLTGSFLSGGAIAVEVSSPKAASSPFTAVQVDTTAASDSRLPFTATIGGSSIASGTDLLFTVMKTALDKSVTTSSPYSYIVDTGYTLSMGDEPWSAGSSIQGAITGAGLKGAKVTSVTSESGVPPPGSLLATVTASSETSLRFTVSVSQDVPPGTNVDLALSVKQSDGSAVVLTYTVP